MTAALADGVIVEPAPEQLAMRAAGWLATLLAASRRERVTVCLSGGSTPERLYELIAERHRSEVPWERIDWFWGDERFVPPDDASSNARMVEGALFSRVPPTTRHPVPTVGMTPAAAASRYAATLAAHYGGDRLQPGRPLFDVVLLGLGADGHTASLFPGTPALGETVRWAAATRAPDDSDRVTLTFPALASTANAAVLVTGAAKRAIVAAVRGGRSSVPAARYRPTGRLTWFLDEEAAAA